MIATEGPVKASFAARIFLLFGLAAPIVTFVIALSGLSSEVKIGLVVLVAAANTVLYFASRNAFTAKKESEATAFAALEDPADEKAEPDTLAVLDEASRFFGASLNQSDMFRLVASRVNEIFPFQAAVLSRPSASTESMSVTEQTGDLAFDDGETFRYEHCLAGIAYLSGDVEIDADLEIETSAFGDKLPEGIASAAAIPLVYDDRVLGVFEIFLAERIADAAATTEKLAAIQKRIAPLFLGSFASDRTIFSNAFTDSVTEIPNERAFYMVLENQLAESMRFRDERPLTVLAIDLKNFRHVNQHFGHSTGDAILTIAAARIRGQLRKMDFLARFEDDEFGIVMPLVDEKAVEDVIGRLKKVFSHSTCQVGEIELTIDLNIGTASFWQDGETPQQLIQHARLRKQQAKAEDPGNVVWFPKEYVN